MDLVYLKKFVFFVFVFQIQVTFIVLLVSVYSILARYLYDLLNKPSPHKSSTQLAPALIKLKFLIRKTDHKHLNT